MANINKDNDTKTTYELSEDDLNKVSGGVGETIDIELQERVMSVIAEQCGRSRSMINLYSKLVTDLDFYSLDFVDLCQALEEEFKILIDEAALLSFVTVEDVVIFISNRVNHMI